MNKLTLNVAIFFFVCISFADTSFGQTRFVNTDDGVKLYLKISGKGDPCLFVHGGPGQGTRSFEEMRGTALEKHLSMIYLDQRGSGRSGSSTNYTLDRMVEDIETVRKALGLRKINLLAHSFGGVIAFNYAKKYPKRVSHLILANATLHFYSPETLKQQIRFATELTKKEFPIDDKMTWEDLKKLLDEARQELNKADISYRILTEHAETIREMIRIDRDDSRNREFGRAVIADPTKYAEYYADYTQATSTVRIPVLILTGTTDHAVGPDHYKLFRFPNQTVEVIPGGHMPYYDNSELFVRLVSDFIKGKSGS